ELLQTRARIRKTNPMSRQSSRFVFETAVQIAYFQPERLAFLEPADGDCITSLVPADSVTNCIFDQRLQNQRRNDAIKYALFDGNLKLQAISETACLDSHVKIENLEFPLKRDLLDVALVHRYA